MPTMQKILPFLLFCVLISCKNDDVEHSKNTPPLIRDWKEIKSDSVLHVLAENSPASFFIYKGKNMGYEYELLHEFTKDHNIRLQVTMVNDLDDMIHKLDSCIGDIIACNLTITESRKAHIDFSASYLQTHQVLIQRKPEGYRKMRRSQIKDSLIQNIEALHGKTIHVWKNSSFYNRLKQLDDAFDLDLKIIATEGDLITEELIRMVSEGEIDYTVADYNVAKIDTRYYPNIDIDFSLGSDDHIAFGLRTTSPQLRDTLNAWLLAKENRSTIGEVRRKYFKRRALSNKANMVFSSLTGEQISPYDDVIKMESEKIGWDWRLVSAVIYQESKFEIWKQSWAGAFGIFQFMPSTAHSYGISPNSSAEDQIKAGIRKLKKNYNQWLEIIPDSSEAIKFTLATFNAGRAHIDDARALCEVYELDDLVWDNNVAEMVKNLAKPTYYRHQVVKYGYCRGSETYKYVSEILQRFEEYKAAFPNELKS